MNKEQLIEIWEAGLLNDQGKDTLIDCFVNGEELYDENIEQEIEDIPEADTSKARNLKEVQKDE